eukprot:327354-Amphidinium_carterae.1
MAICFNSRRGFCDLSFCTRGVTVEYLTDVEGNWEYFLRYVALSTILYWDECSQHERPSSSAPVLGRLSLRTGQRLSRGGMLFSTLLGSA